MADDKDNRNDDKALPLENSRSQVWAFFEKHPMDPGCAEHLKVLVQPDRANHSAGADRSPILGRVRFDVERIGRFGTLNRDRRDHLGLPHA